MHNHLFLLPQEEFLFSLMKSKVKAEIARMEKLGIIRIVQPTEWCAGMINARGHWTKTKRKSPNLRRFNQTEWKCMYRDLPTSKNWRPPGWDRRLLRLQQVGRQFRVLAGDLSRAMSASHHFSDLFCQILFPTTSFLLEISTRTISEKNRAWKLWTVSWTSWYTERRWQVTTND